MNRTAMMFYGVGFELLAVIIGAFILGPALDKQMGWDGTGFLVVGALLFIGWVAHFIYLIQKYMKDEDLDNEQRKD